ncbi:OLC1v1027751C1 [Oldenlandia corymbosa var. corymbosa]|uniref:OLC1v1027751C1 n=1 Tax=Oldenlandia corymbosa var. corymbosa TaxID=529605 RepID=A0AAV1CAY0_OLDCO|nr:OLC1v1027751C1 [Oldenlandia corymbosa var. corymbosa]
MAKIGDSWGNFGSSIAALLFFYTMYRNYFPNELRQPIARYIRKITRYFNPYIRITFSEYEGDSFQRNKGYKAIERYLDQSSSQQARRLKANFVPNPKAFVLSMQDHEEVTDDFQGIKVWWASSRTVSNRQSISLYPREDEKKHFILTFHKRHREVITETYLRQVLDVGEEIMVKERRRKLYTNNKSERVGPGKSMWSYITFQHPATFDTLAMEPNKKQEIVDDLINFSKAKDYYAEIGKAWKRGYLLYGPPGTGKSTMIAAMANLLNYDVYDLELTSVKDNTELRKLLNDTSGKSIIVIEDIDCSLDLTGQREKKQKDGEKKDSTEDKVKKKLEDNNKGSQVTLSGLLNFIDGLWSACGGERIIVFTTNYVEKLDPALIRRGRMDKHIELSYCGFEAFKELAKIYLKIESHELFARVGTMLEETKMTPADVAENLMPRVFGEGAEFCLERLIKAIEQAKEDARLKAEEEAKAKKTEEAEAEGLKTAKKEKQESGGKNEAKCAD